MANPPLALHSIYTIVDPALLKKIAAKGVGATFQERKRWVTGRLLFDASSRKALHTPVLIEDATDCSRLLYWGLLTSVELSEAGARFRVDQLRRLRGQRSPQDLTLRSTGKKIAPGFIRPYAICRTPAFIRPS